MVRVSVRKMVRTGWAASSALGAAGVIARVVAAATRRVRWMRWGQRLEVGRVIQ
jgi:hypothetical protein